MAGKKKKSSSKKSRRVKTIRAIKSTLTYYPRQRIAIHKKTIRCLYRWGNGFKA